ncbi:hypothetical protein Daus18300_012796 [Diaporthe australafricana]|uniref:C2H2-type domain-containing protein n=1 Tax=Diaporthe australafricana TaxID=127596 RepID=A0ABR3W1J4_9PEZI
MYESSPRSREIANALFQIDKLTEDQARGVIRHLLIDDAVYNEAQCSHLAGLINGTLHDEPREGVNAIITCDSALSAATTWEKTYTSFPGHVSATFNPPIDDQAKLPISSLQAEPPMSSLQGEPLMSSLLQQHPMSLPQAAWLEDETTGPVKTTDQTRETDPSLDNLPGLKGLSITNNGSLTLHYHSYPASPSSPSGSAIVSRKRALQETEDEQHSEALASLTDCDHLTTSSPNAESSAKRLKTEKSTANKVNGNTVKPDFETLQRADGKAKEKAGGKNTAKNVKEETGKKAKPVKKCTRCGTDYTKSANRYGRTPCCYHPGM